MNKTEPRKESTGGRPGRAPHRLFGIRFIVTAVTLLLVAGAVTAVGLVQERYAREVLTKELQARLVLEARKLAMTSSGAFLTDFPELTLYPLISEMQSEQPELEIVTVFDDAGSIHGHADSRRLGTAYTYPPGLVLEKIRVSLRDQEMVRGNRDLIVVSTPVKHPNGQIMGTAAVGIQRGYLDRIVTAARQRQLLAVAIVLAVGLVLAFVMVGALLRPVDALRAGLERIGKGDLENPVIMRDRTEFGMLADTMNAMASELKTAQRDMVEKERMAHELTLAREIQASLLPETRLEAGHFVIDGAHRAAQEVGGDYYDAFPLPGGKIGVAIADVSGKGLVGCLVMSMLSALLQAFRESYESPSQLLIELDARLSQRLKPGSFVTMFYGILDPTSGSLTFASAGHCPAFVYRSKDKTVESLPTQGIPLGAVRGGAIASTLADDVVQLESGDILFQFTDGINESFSGSSEEQFGLDRIRDILADRANRGSEAVIDEIQQQLQTWQRGGTRLDDETILVVSRELEKAMPVPTLPVSAATRVFSPAPASIPIPANDSAPSEFNDNGDGSPPPAKQVGVDEWLREARESGAYLRMSADMDKVQEVRGWLALRPELMTVSDTRMELLSTALYEAVANIVEHGYHRDAAESLELWCVVESELCPGRGYFLIRDQGEPFAADNWEASNFHDPEVWRRGRGLGLDIIHRVMSQVIHEPGSKHGNLTMLIFEWSIADEPTGT